MRKFISTFLLLVAIVLGVCSIAFLALPGVQMKETVGGITGSVGIMGFNFLFGGLNVKTSFSGDGAGLDLPDVKFNGGLSYFALIGFILLILGLIFFIVALFKKGKMLPTLGFILVLVGSISMLLLKVAGTDVEIQKGITVSFTDFLGDYQDSTLKLGSGAILFAVSGMLSSVAGLLSIFFKKR